MSKKRLIDTKFWEDGYVINLLPDEKTLFLYFLTSPMSNMCGIYECPIKLMAVHTGFDRENLETMVKRFEGKIHYIDGWVYIRNFQRHQSNSPTIKKAIKDEMEKVPDKILKKIADIEEESEGDTLFLFETETIEDKEEKDSVNEDHVDWFVVSYNEKINDRAKLTTGARKKLLLRMKEFTIDELMRGIDNFSNSSWWMQHNRSRGMEWFLRSNSQVNKWLEMEVDQVNEVLNI